MRAITLTTLAICCTLAGCNHLLPARSTLLEPAPLLPAPDSELKDPQGNVAVPSALDQFLLAARAAYQPGAQPSALHIYVSKGVGLSDQQCDAWLNALSHQNTEIELGTGLFNIGSNTLVAALGLAKASAGAISGVGIGSAAVNAASQDYRATILFTPDFALLHQKINKAKQDARSLILQSEYKDFDQSTRDLVVYDRMCSRDAVTMVLQQSLASSRYEIPELAKPPTENPPTKPVNPQKPNTPPANAQTDATSRLKELLIDKTLLQNLSVPRVLSGPDGDVNR